MKNQVATPLTCAPSNSADCDIGDYDPTEGGEDDPQDETRAQLIVALNNRVLRFPQAQTWLKGIIADPRSGALYDENTNAFAKRAQDEVIIHASGRPTRISRENAVALHRLFLIRGTDAFKSIMTQYNQQQE